MKDSEYQDNYPSAAVPWVNLLRNSFGSSSRPPFTGEITPDEQTLELMDISNQFFAFADFSTQRILYMSPNVKNVLGYDPEEFDLNKIYEIIHPDDRKAVFEIGKMVLNREMNYIAGESHSHFTYYLTYRAKMKNGRYTRISRTISRHIHPVGGIYELVVIRDISHVHCGTKVTFSLLGLRPFREMPGVAGGSPVISKREQEIIYHISRGLTSRRIAYELNISEFTVNTHRKNIMRKTGTNNLVDMLIFAASNGII